MSIQENINQALSLAALYSQMNLRNNQLIEKNNEEISDSFKDVKEATKKSIESLEAARSERFTSEKIINDIFLKEDFNNGI